MKQINKFLLSSVASFFILGQAAADQNAMSTSDIKAEIAQQITIAIADMNVENVEMIAKAQLDEMTFKQNVEQFLFLANYNEETKSATPVIIAE